MIRSTLSNQSATGAESFWSTTHVQDVPERGRPFVRPTMQDENPKRFRVTFLVFGTGLRKENQVTLIYYGLDFKDARQKMLHDTDGAVFKVHDVVDTENDYRVN